MLRAVMCLIAVLAVAAAIGPWLVGVPGGSEDPGEAPSRPEFTPTATETADPGPRLLAVYPNPIPPGDAGEFVVIDVPRGTDLGRLVLRDGEDVLRLPNRTAGGRVVVALGDAEGSGSSGGFPPGLVVRGELSLSNAGETIRLANRSATLDRTTYADAPESELWRPAVGDGGRWVPRGASGFYPRSVAGVPVTVGALPDADGLAMTAITNATRRIYLAGYTFRSERVADALIAAAGRGVAVSILLDGGPVGGILADEAALLDRLAAAGVSVRVLDGPAERYRFHHPKYAVVDDRAFVTSENWQPSGTGGHGSRGWAALVRSPRLAADLARVFRADRDWRAAIPWASYRANTTFRDGHPASDGDYPSRFPTRRARADRVTLVTAPDNAEAHLAGLLDGADESIRIQQVGIDPRHPLLERAIAAARRGVRVRILLDGAWYVREENRNLTRRLRRLATAENLPLEARIAEPRSRFSHVHVKGIIVDRRRVYVGSLNWNNVSLRENREVGVIVSDRRLATRLVRVFRADWRDGAWRLPVGGLVVATVLGGLGSRWIVSTLSFENADGRVRRRR